MSSEATPPANNSPSPNNRFKERAGLAAVFLFVVGGGAYTWVADRNLLTADFNGNASLTITGPHTVQVAGNNGTKELNFEGRDNNSGDNTAEMSAVLKKSCELQNKIKETNISERLHTTSFMRGRETAQSFGPHCE